MKRILATYLLVLSLATFMVAQGRGAVLAEEITETCEEKGTESEVPKFDPASSHAKACSQHAEGIAARIVFRTHEAVPIGGHVDDVPVPPPEF